MEIGHGASLKHSKGNPVCGIAGYLLKVTTIPLVMYIQCPPYEAGFKFHDVNPSIVSHIVPRGPKILLPQ